MKKIHIKHISVFIVALIFCIGVYIYFGGGMYKHTTISDNDYITLDDWRIEETGAAIKLPASFRYDNKNRTYTFMRSLSDVPEFEDVPYIMMESKYFDYSIYLDDKLIYEFAEPENGFSKASGYQIRFVKLGNDISNSTLKIKIEPKLADMVKYSISPLKVGSKADMLWKIVKSELGSIIFTSLIVLMGILAMLAYFVMRGHTHADKLFFVGMLSFMCGTYILCQNQITHLMEHNSYMLYYIEFMSLSTIPSIVSIFMGMNIKGKIKKVYGTMTALFIINILMQIILNFVCGIDFRAMLIITHIFIVMLGVLIAATMIVCRDDKETRLMLLSLILPIIGATVDLVMMYVRTHGDIVYYFSMGLYVFIAIQAFIICKDYIKYKNDIMMAQTYEKLAFTDGLTGLYNRLSFENDINEPVVPGRAACLSVDINNLKELNDSMGHSAGDILICTMAQILEDAVGDRGKTYRIGGDEFIAIIKDTNEIEIKSLLARIENSRTKHNAANGINVEFAIGVSFSDDDDSSYEKIVARADRKMYFEKHRMKSTKNNDETEN